MNRRRKDRLTAIAASLPSREEVQASVRQRIEQQALRRIEDGTATVPDFVLIWDTPAQRRWLLELAGEARYGLTRGLPLRPGLWTAAALLVSWPPDEEPPADLYEQIHRVAQPVDPAARRGNDWAAANWLVVLLGQDGGAELRREYYDHLDWYDPQWLALIPEGGPFEEMAARVEDGTADQRDHFFTHMPHIRIYRTEFMVSAVGHRLARKRGETIYLTEPRHLAAELLSYFPDENAPPDLWRGICAGGDRTPTAGTYADWREYNRCRVVLGRWDHGKRARELLAENWQIFEAEYNYLARRGELP